MSDEDFDEEYEMDPLDEAMAECGMTEDGLCMLSGTEYCDFECPFSG